MAGLMAAVAISENSDIVILDKLFLEDVTILSDFEVFVSVSKDNLEILENNDFEYGFVTFLFNGMFPNGQVILEPTIFFKDSSESFIFYDKDDLKSLFEFFMVWNARFVLNGCYPNLSVTGLYELKTSIDD